MCMLVTKITREVIFKVLPNEANLRIYDLQIDRDHLFNHLQRSKTIIFNMEGVKLNHSSLWQNTWNAFEVNSLGFLAEDILVID